MGAMAWSFESAVKVINHRSGHGEEKPTMDPNRPPILSSHNSDQASHEVGGEIRLCPSVDLSFIENEMVIETGGGLLLISWSGQRVVAEPIDLDADPWSGWPITPTTRDVDLCIELFFASPIFGRAAEPCVKFSSTSLSPPWFVSVATP
ncbi:hypothetical protein U1Q18_040120 [Sarracenia purpurea var. burkii]